MQVPPAKRRRSATSTTIRLRSAPAALAAGAVLCLLPGLHRALADEADERSRLYAPTTNWSEVGNDSLNISTFVYRDRNRDGEYDLGDRPMAAVAVVMTEADGTETVRRSNIDGFANFGMSVGEPAEIRGPGAFSFRVIVPPGWQPTSRNVEQKSVFRLLDGSPAGIVATIPPGKVGLAPELTIAGRIAGRTPDGDLRPLPGAALVASGPDGSTVEVALAEDGSFRLPAAQGVWRLTARSPDGEEAEEREVVVRDAPVRLSATILGEPGRAPAPERIEVDFETVSGDALAKVPNGTAGLEWDYVNAVDERFYEGEGYINGATSGRYVAYNSSGHPVTVSDPEGFDFIGAYFAVAWRAAEGERLVVGAWRDGSLVAAETIALSSLGPVWFDADYRDIDRLTLATAHYWQFVTDDMAFRVNGSR